MDLNRLTHEADDLIRKVVSRYNQLYVPAGNISQLELDLMLDDLRKLYETFKSIGFVNLTLQNNTNGTEVAVTNQVPEEPGYKPATEPTLSEKPFLRPEPSPKDHQPEPEFRAEPETVPEPAAEPSPAEFDEREIIAASAQNPEPIPEMQVHAEEPGFEKPIQDTTENAVPAIDHEPAMLADRFNAVNKSLSESLATSQVPGVMGSRLLFQPIADLSTGIGLNDKFSFISELFANNPAQYEEAITRINKAVNIDEAGWILQKYHSEDWNHKAETLARLKDFIKRRFI